MKLLLVVCLLCGIASPSFALDREAFTFTRYDLDVRVEPEQQRLAVRGKITLRNDSSTAQKNLSLQISSTLDWRAIQLGGKPLQFVSQTYTSDIDHTGALSEAIVSLPQEVQPKGTVELNVGYEGVIPLDATRLTRIGVPEETAKHSDWDQIGKTFTAVRGIGHVAWYPTATEVANLSDVESVFETVGRWQRKSVDTRFHLAMSVAGTFQAPPTILCNGKQVKSDCEFIQGATTPTFVIGDFQRAESNSATVFYLPEQQSSAETYLRSTELALPLVTDWFGTPREKVSTVELADTQAAPFESGDMLLTPLAVSDFKLFELTAAHQLTHAVVASPRLWIYEGLAHFAQALDRERNSGRAAALDFMGLHRAAVAGGEKALQAEAKDDATRNSLTQTSSEEFYRSKSMYVWWMLRDLVGEAVMKKALAAYHPEADVTLYYMQQLIEAQTKRDVKWFFNDWVYNDRGLPDFHVESVFATPAANGHTSIVTVTVENLGEAGAEVPVILRMEGGEVQQRLEVRAKSKASIRIPAASRPLEVVVNDGSVPESDVSNNTFKI